jgi:DNA-binding protein H-NS
MEKEFIEKTLQLFDDIKIHIFNMDYKIHLLKQKNERLHQEITELENKNKELQEMADEVAHEYGYSKEELKVRDNVKVYSKDRTQSVVGKICNINDFREPSMKYAIEVENYPDVIFCGEDNLEKIEVKEC